MNGTVLRTGRWHLVVPLAMLMHGLGLVTEKTFVSIPMVEWLVPLPVLIALVTITIGLLPLYSAFACLEATLLRARDLRAGQVAGALVVGFLGAWPAFREPAMEALLCLLFAVGIASVVVLGEYAWVVALTAGFLSVVLDGSPAQPVTTMLESVPLGWWVVLLGSAAGVFVAAGPREVRRTA